MFEVIVDSIGIKFENKNQILIKWLRWLTENVWCNLHIKIYNQK